MKNERTKEEITTQAQIRRYYVAVINPHSVVILAKENRDLRVANKRQEKASASQGQRS
jgi:hypothetical protein